MGFLRGLIWSTARLTWYSFESTMLLEDLVPAELRVVLFILEEDIVFVGDEVAMMPGRGWPPFVADWSH